MSKVYRAILRKTCISNLPVEAIKEKGNEYVATISTNCWELDIIPIERWFEIAREWAMLSDIHSLQERKHVRDSFAYAIEYRVGDDGSTLYTPATSLIGEPGDKLEFFWNEDRWTIRNPKLRGKSSTRLDVEKE